MISAYLYRPLYLVAVTILTVIATSRYHAQYNYGERISDGENLRGYILPLLFALFIGFRPLSGIYFVDMWNYNSEYYAFLYGRNFHFNPLAENFIFDNLFGWLGSKNYEIKVCFVLIALIYFVLTYKALTRLFGPNSTLAFIVFLGAFSTFSYGTNGIKAGAAAAFFLCALSYRDKPLMASLFLVLSLGFHHSMKIPIAAFIIAWFIKDSKYYFAVWIIALLIAAAHITYFQELFAGMADERGALYLNNTEGNWGGKSGFRLDFILYSAFPVFIGSLAIFKCKLKSKIYSFLFNVYLLTNAIWMLCMYASFTNRIAYLSWLMYPIVTIYPFFCKDIMPAQVTRLKLVIWFQLLFTLFMNIIYG